MHGDVILFSGGLDSLCTALRLPEAALLYVWMGAGPSTVEETQAGRLAGELGRRHNVWLLDGLRIEAGSNAYVPYRNLIFATQAVAFMREMAVVEHGSYDAYSSIYVYMGGLRDDRVADKTEEAFQSMSDCLSAIGNEAIAVKSLFWGMDKTTMVGEALRDFPEFPKLARLSVSCYKAGALTDSRLCGCGNCPSCFRKAVALRANDVDCAGWFLTNPFRSETAVRYWQRLLSGELFRLGYDMARLAAMDKVYRMEGIG